MRVKLIFILICCFISSCCTCPKISTYYPPIHPMPIQKNGFEKFCEQSEFKKEYREWAFVNGKGLLTGRGVRVDNYWNVGYSLDKIDYKKDYQNIYDNWFKDYITLKKLEKWKDKPAPKGYYEFLEKEKHMTFYND